MIEEKFFHNGSIIVDEGSPACEAYIVKKGSIEITKLFDTKRVILATLGPGQIVGELGVLREHRNRTAQAQAKGLTEVLAIPKAFFDTMQEQLDPVGRQLLLALATRLERTTEMKNFDRYDNPLRSYQTLLGVLGDGKTDDLDITDVYRAFRRVLGIERPELREILGRMECVNLIELMPNRKAPQKVKLVKHAQVDKVINAVTEDRGMEYFDFNLSANEFVEFNTAAEEKGVAPEKLWEYCVAGKLPRDALFIARKSLNQVDFSLAPDEEPAEEEAAESGASSERPQARFQGRALHGESDGPE
jgi:CRP-like cAMP-binding protein